MDLMLRRYIVCLYTFPLVVSGDVRTSTSSRNRYGNRRDPSQDLKSPSCSVPQPSLPVRSVSVSSYRSDGFLPLCRRPSRLTTRFIPNLREIVLCKDRFRRRSRLRVEFHGSIGDPTNLRVCFFTLILI